MFGVLDRGFSRIQWHPLNPRKSAIQTKYSMQMQRNILLLCLILLSFSHCSTDIELEGPADLIPVVYGILEANDTAHYLRIEKVFQAQGANAEQLAQDPDQIYYGVNEMTASLEKENGSGGPLERVDGNLEGFIREAGPFASAPNVLYKIKSNQLRLDGGENVKLQLNFSENIPPVTAETTILQPVTISNSSPPTSVNMGYERTIRTSWSSGEEVTLHSLQWIIQYRERRVPGDWEDKTLVWTVSDRIEDTPSASQETFTFQGRQFYDFLAASLEEAANIQRQFVGIEVQVLSMGTEFEEILRLANANVGITSTQFDPVYTNIEGGIGVLTSRARATRTGISLSAISIDSLKNGMITGGLGF